MVEVLKQGQFKPKKMEEQVLSIFAVTKGFADKLPVDKILEWEAGLEHYVKTNYAAVIAKLGQEKAMSDEITEGLSKAVKEFTEQFGQQGA